MKRILNSRTLAILVFGIGPLALLFWALGANGELVLGFWLVLGVIIKFAMASQNDTESNRTRNTDLINKQNEGSIDKKSDIIDLVSKENKEQTESTLFQSKENYHDFWHSLIELSPELNNKRVTCYIIDKYEVSINDGAEVKKYKYIQTNLVRDRYLKNTDNFFSNLGFMLTTNEKERWHKYQVRKLLEKFEARKMKIDYDAIVIGDRISFNIKYNEPPILTLPSEVGDGHYQLTWEELEKEEYIGDEVEFEFSNFEIEKL